MDRTQLTNLIDSGRAVALDLYAIGKEISSEDSRGQLFETDALNRSIILKHYEKVQAPSGKSTMFTADILDQFGGGWKSAPTVNVNTVIYFPYDSENVYGGGESIVYTGRTFIKTLAMKIAQGKPPADLMARIKADLKTLDLLDSMHSLDPFLFRSKAEQFNVADDIHPAYFAITPEEWTQFQLPIRDKIARLVAKALSEMDSKEDTAAEQDHVENFLQKIWQAKDVNGVEPFVRSLQIDPEEAPPIFFAWKAVCYYQLRFSLLLESLKTMFQWIGNDQLCFPIDFLQLSKSHRDRIGRRRTALREKVRDGYIAAHKVLGEYEYSYNQFVNEDKPRLFLNFLADAETSYLLLANHVSIATHSVNLWKSYMAQYGAELRHEVFMELFDGLLMLYDVKKDD